MFATDRPGGGFSARNASVFYLLNMAYGLPQNRILGGPDWIDTEFFDVEAKYEPADTIAPVPRVSLMLQTLLRDRFALDAAMEKRDRPVYALRLARSDGRLGPGLQPAEFDCANPDVQRKVVRRPIDAARPGSQRIVRPVNAMRSVSSCRYGSPTARDRTTGRQSSGIWARSPRG